jgi:hypothetical protein
MLQPLDGPSKQFSVNVDTITVVELKKDALPLDERKVVTVQAEGKVYIYFGDDDVVPSAATVAADGFIHFKNAKESYEASASQSIYVIADSGTVKVRAVERA